MNVQSEFSRRDGISNIFDGETHEAQVMPLIGKVSSDRVSVILTSLGYLQFQRSLSAKIGCIPAAVRGWGVLLSKMAA
jgi:hypothetical protein